MEFSIAFVGQEPSKYYGNGYTRFPDGNVQPNNQNCLLGLAGTQIRFSPDYNANEVAYRLTNDGKWETLAPPCVRTFPTPQGEMIVRVTQ